MASFALTRPAAEERPAQRVVSPVRRRWCRPAAALGLAAGWLALAAPASAIPVWFTDNGWTKAYDEGFGSSGSLSDWSQYRAEGSTGGSGSGRYTSNAVSVANGSLVIDAYSVGSTDYVGSLRSTQSWTYGYFEARIKFKTKSGMHQAFWMMPQGKNHADNNGTRPDLNGAEIDIVEHRIVDENGTNIGDDYWTANHWGGYGANHQSRGKLNQNKTGNDQWHTYGVQWNQDMYKFFIDDTYVGHTINDGISGTAEYAIFSNNIGVNWSGSVLNSYGPKGDPGGKMEVDWFRVWQLGTAGAAAVPEPASASAATLAGLALLTRRTRRTTGA